MLTSVQKTEESLRRLKNLRDKTASLLTNESAATGSALEQRTAMSDDDKIRLQLHVDVTHWATAIELLGVPMHSVQRIAELIAIVEQSSPLRGAEK